MTCFSINVSTGGVFVETESSLPVETPLVLKFILPGHSNPINCKGRVAWVNDVKAPRNRRLPPGMGLQFMDPSLEDMAVVRSFVMQSLAVPKW